MKIESIVSFLPSGTELIFELGSQNLLRGVTHECLYPDEARKIPRVITSVFDPTKITSKEIDEITTKLLCERKDIFRLDEKVLRKASPDLIISQTTCEVCSAHNNQVNRAMEILGKKPMLHSMDPHNLKEILDSVTSLAVLIDRKEEGDKLVDKLQNRINVIKNVRHEKKPNVLAIEWIDPFFTAGHWIPEMIEIAGGNNMISNSSEHSRRISINEITKADPDIIIMMPCGFDTARTIKEYDILRCNAVWKKLRAVQNDHVYAVNANAYFSKPSIRTIIGLEVLAKILHPNKFSDLQIPSKSYSKITH